MHLSSAAPIFENRYDAGRQLAEKLVEYYGKPVIVLGIPNGGVAVAPALPAGLIRGLFVRFDLRMHRKIVVIDGEVAYTGSLNLVDPRFFKQGAGVGQWVDAMVRVRGPAVFGLAGTFLEDWELETGVGVDRLLETGDLQLADDCGNTVVQVVPSGPLLRNDAIASGKAPPRSKATKIRWCWPRASRSCWVTGDSQRLSESCAGAVKRKTGRPSSSWTQ